VDAVVVDRDLVLLAVDVRDSFGALFVQFVQLEDAFDKIGWILGIWIAARLLQHGYLVVFSVLFSELLDPAPTDVVPIGHVLRVEIVADNEPRDSVTIILVQLHFVSTLKGFIISTKSFPDWTQIPSVGLSPDL
jgi:hypothetical protein